MTVITRHGPEVLDELRPLWLAMAHHHSEILPELGLPHDDDTSWALRRAFYAERLETDGAFVLLARDDDGAPVGYALVTFGSASHTFAEPERFGFLDSLAVLAQARGGGIGDALVARVQQEIEAAGVHELRLEAFAGNARARAFYERLGFETFVVALRRP